MVLLRRLYGRLRLTVNKAKSAVAGVFGRKFLGYAFWADPGGTTKRRVADKPMAAFKQRIRQLTRRSGGRRIRDVVERLSSYVLGWKAYYRLAQTPRVWSDLDKWMRHRLRAVQLKQWKRGKTMYRELRALGAKPELARRGAANSRRWWRNSGTLLNAVLTLEWSDKLGMPRLTYPQLPEPPGADPQAGWCGRGAIQMDRPRCRSRGGESQAFSRLLIPGEMARLPAAR